LCWSALSNWASEVGSKSAAIDLYRSRKDDARKGLKLPKLRSSRFVSLAELIDDALEFVANHKDQRNYESKATIVKKALGANPAGDVHPLVNETLDCLHYID
jgi:hypothetical protein